VCDGVTVRRRVCVCVCEGVFVSVKREGGRGLSGHTVFLCSCHISSLLPDTSRSLAEKQRAIGGIDTGPFGSRIGLPNPQ
jgi:hypothetical protein